MPDRQRLFFALWPDEATRAALAAAAAAAVADAPGKRTPAANLHLTLLFLGHLDADGRARAEAAAAAVRGAPFTLIIERTGWFSGARVAWLGPRAVPPQLAELRRALTARLGAARVPCDENEFHPHVTCLRQAPAPPHAATVAPVDWAVSEFVLVLSDRGRYQVVHRWPLGVPRAV